MSETPHRIVNGRRVDLTAEEIAAEEADQVVRQREATLRNWQSAMAATDASVPRIVEDILDAQPALLAALPQPTRDRVAAKKTLRAARPE